MPTLTPPPHPRVASPRAAVLLCPACRRAEQGPSVTVRRPVRYRPPECCGHPMVPAVPEAAGPDAEAVADPLADRRDGGRRLARPGTRFEVRRGGRGPDLAVALLDVSAAGLKAAVRAFVRDQERVVVWLAPPAEKWVYRGQAVVCWLADGAEGTALVGLRLRSRLPDAAVADLAEPDTR